MLKEMVRSLVHLSGYEVMSLSRAQGDRRCVAAILQEQDINVVLDVGANVGQFARWIRDAGYTGKIVSFEPLSDAHHTLSQMAKRDSRWIVAPRMALGSGLGSIDIHVAGNGVSSSILPMLAAHKGAAPDSRYVETQSVVLNRLDDVYPLSQEDRLLLKVDVQGYEKAVLDGSVRLLKNCRAVIIEMSLVPLYEGQSLAIELWTHLMSVGFQACYFNPGFRDPRSGRMLQMDGVFVRQ
jgi:FkbM family methyltransferase